MSAIFLTIMTLCNAGDHVVFAVEARHGAEQLVVVGHLAAPGGEREWFFFGGFFFAGFFFFGGFFFAAFFGAAPFFAAVFFCAGGRPVAAMGIPPILKAPC